MSMPSACLVLKNEANSSAGTTSLSRTAWENRYIFHGSARAGDRSLFASARLGSATMRRVKLALEVGRRWRRRLDGDWYSKKWAGRKPFHLGITTSASTTARETSAVVRCGKMSYAEMATAEATRLHNVATPFVSALGKDPVRKVLNTYLNWNDVGNLNMSCTSIRYAMLVGDKTWRVAVDCLALTGERWEQDETNEFQNRLIKVVRRAKIGPGLLVDRYIWAERFLAYPLRMAVKSISIDAAFLRVIEYEWTQMAMGFPFPTVLQDLNVLFRDLYLKTVKLIFIGQLPVRKVNGIESQEWEAANSLLTSVFNMLAARGVRIEALLFHKANRSV